MDSGLYSVDKITPYVIASLPVPSCTCIMISCLFSIVFVCYSEKFSFD